MAFAACQTVKNFNDLFVVLKKKKKKTLGQWVLRKIYNNTNSV